ncbi:4-hydroxybutyrate coenzyme a transferase [hydrocarbon metagenome]|uniref:4-hydroxybutyrate coenzyme a transferase n=1 Tax=hydrocarbon metagenome TaxID=938273 RepID=A0A0W8E941_9ZZZZ
MSFKYTEEYAQKFSFAEEAVKVVKSGNQVIYAFGVCSINELDRALSMRKDELQDVKIICNDMTCRYYAMDAGFTVEHFNFYEEMCQGVRESSLSKGDTKKEARRTDRNSSDYDVRPGYVFMATVSPMDKNGYFWFGRNVAENQIYKKYYEMADYVILEINERILEGKIPEQECIHISKVDKIVGSNNKDLLQGFEKPGKSYIYHENAATVAYRAV